MKLIDKDVLVAELEKLRKEWSFGSSVEAKYRVEAYKELIDSLDTLEVKEINLDFEKELYKAFGQVKNFTLGMHIAKHFFELGLKA